MSWGEDHQIATVSYGGEQALVCEHYTMSDGSALRASSHCVYYGVYRAVYTVQNI